MYPVRFLSCRLKPATETVESSPHIHTLHPYWDHRTPFCMLFNSHICCMSRPSPNQLFRVKISESRLRREHLKHYTIIEQINGQNQQFTATVARSMQFPLATWSTLLSSQYQRSFSSKWTIPELVKFKLQVPFFSRLTWNTLTFAILSRSSSSTLLALGLQQHILHESDCRFFELRDGRNMSGRYYISNS
jgi:hypothetical protein